MPMGEAEVEAKHPSQRFSYFVSERELFGKGDDE